MLKGFDLNFVLISTYLKNLVKMHILIYYICQFYHTGNCLYINFYYQVMYIYMNLGLQLQLFLIKGAPEMCV